MMMKSNTAVSWGTPGRWPSPIQSLIVSALIIGSRWPFPAAIASTHTFNGQSGVDFNWSTGANWADGMPPVSGSANLELRFHSNSTANLISSNQDLATPFVLQRLSVAWPSPEINGMPLAFSDLGAPPAIAVVDPSPGSGNLTINTDVILGADITVSPAAIYSKPSFYLNGSISGAGGLRLNGGGNLHMAGASANSYAGTTVVANGVLYLNKPASVLAVPGNLVINSGGGTRDPRGAMHILNNNQIGPNATVTINSGVLALEGGDQTLTNIEFGQGNRTLTG